MLPCFYLVVVLMLILLVTLLLSEGRKRDAGMSSLLVPSYREVGRFWCGHSLIQIPSRLLDYDGGAETMVLVYLYERAEDISFRKETKKEIRIQVGVETIMKRTGYQDRQVRRALDTLDADKCIRVEHTRDEAGRVKTHVYLLLHSQTAEPLIGSPRIFGVCQQNRETPFITAPKELRELMMKMKAPGRRFYLGALSLGSERQSMSFFIQRDDFLSASRMGVSWFYAGLSECRKLKLVSYEKETLTLNDPRTGEPSQRHARELVYDKNTNWKFRLDDITGPQWEQIIKRAWKREFIVGSSGWTVSGVDDLCPFCGENRGFSMCYRLAKYSCKKCDRFGKLGQLLRSILRVTQWEQVRQYIRETIALTQNPHEGL